MFKKLVKRTILTDIREHLDKPEISLIVGPRQAGKTTIMVHLKDELVNRGEKVLFLNLDLESDRQYFVSQNALINKITLTFGNKKGFVFIDEIQRKEDAGIFLKGIYDLGLPHKFIISGSGSIELKEKIHESLAGRKRMFAVNPISLLEFIRYKTDYQYEEREDLFFSVEAKLANELLEEYLNFGGYPRVILSKTLDEKQYIIDEIFRSYIDRDIAHFLHVEKIDAFSKMIRLLANSIGQMSNYTTIGNTVGIAAATLQNYLWYAEHTFSIRRIVPYFRTAEKEISKSPTFYFYDIGLRNYATGMFGRIHQPTDASFVFENLICSIISDIHISRGGEVHFWRTKDKADVDFVVDFGSSILPIEVKYKTLEKPQIEKSLRNFIERYHPIRAIVVNRSLRDRMQVGSTTIEFMTAFDLARLRLDEYVRLEDKQ